MKTPEYREGPESLERFESLARAILQAPKPKIKPAGSVEDLVALWEAYEQRRAERVAA